MNNTLKIPQCEQIHVTNNVLSLCGEDTGSHILSYFISFCNCVSFATYYYRKEIRQNIYNSRGQNASLSMVFLFLSPNSRSIRNISTDLEWSFYLDSLPGSIQSRPITGFCPLHSSHQKQTLPPQFPCQVPLPLGLHRPSPIPRHLVWFYPSCFSHYS